MSDDVMSGGEFAYAGGEVVEVGAVSANDTEPMVIGSLSAGTKDERHPFLSL